jgi:hypothetical protein
MSDFVNVNLDYIRKLSGNNLLLDKYICHNGVTKLQLIRYSRTSPFFANAMRAPARSNRVHTNLI